MPHPAPARTAVAESTYSPSVLLSGVGSKPSELFMLTTVRVVISIWMTSSYRQPFNIDTFLRSAIGCTPPGGKLNAKDGYLALLAQKCWPKRAPSGDVEQYVIVLCTRRINSSSVIQRSRCPPFMLTCGRIRFPMMPCHAMPCYDIMLLHHCIALRRFDMKMADFVGSFADIVQHNRSSFQCSPMSRYVETSPCCPPQPPPAPFFFQVKSRVH